MEDLIILYFIHYYIIILCRRRESVLEWKRWIYYSSVTSDSIFIIVRINVQYDQRSALIYSKMKFLFH